MPSQPPPESAAKGEEGDVPEDKVTRGNFEALAKGLFSVTPAENAAEEARQKSAKAKPPS
jgi:hypothetical protein